MIRPLLLITAVGAALALAGCSSEKTDTPAGDETASPAVGAPVGTDAFAEIVQNIPLSIRGRWGLVPADCTTTRGDEKGLLVIGPDSLKFYESLGKLGQIAERSDTRIRARFAFTGEGMEWTHDVVLDAQDGGKTLIRQNFGPDAEPGPYKYTRC